MQLEWHPTSPHCFCSGSYDEKLRIWDDRNLLKPLSEVHIEGGGIWRTKWSIGDEMGSKRYDNYIVAAAMHAGCSVIALDSSYQMSKMCTYKDAASQNTLCYGASILDRQPSWYSDDDDKEVDVGVAFSIGSCSFYEDVIHIWSCAF